MQGFLRVVGCSTARLAGGCVSLSLAYGVMAAPVAPPRTPPGRTLHTYYVSATAATGGDGSATAPFSTLAQVETASTPGDTIIVVPSPSTVPPLDGGLALKPNQHLLGGGPAVLAAGPPVLSGGPATVVAAGLSALPAVANSTNATHNGDAIVLAPGVEIANIVVKGSYRGGIYGIDALNINIHDNDISGSNTSGTVGFVVQPFYLEQYAAGVASHAANGIPAGWGAILIDGSMSTGDAQINRNYVHDGVCADGIDVRAGGNSIITATINNNFVTRLIQCRSISTLEGMGMQATANGNLTVGMDSNSQDSNGSPGANSDSLFTNIGGSGVIKQVINNDAYHNGIGGGSTNGFEFIIGDGQNADGEVTVTNSIFDTNPGDMLEEFNRGINSTAHLILQNVIVRNTTISGGLPVYAMPAGTARTPDNTGECLGIGSVGAFDHTILEMTNVQFSGCGNNGIEVTNNHLDADGVGFPHLIDISLDHVSITGSKFYNLWMNNVTPLTQLRIKVQDTNLTGSSTGVAVAFDQQTTAGTVQSDVDLGGGNFGSAGRNCLGGGALLDLEANGYRVYAANNWWGQASGPASGKVVASGTGSIVTAPILTSPPPVCNR